MSPHDILSAVALGLVEGITEFLPISSTGHLILVNRWFGFADEAFTKLFDIFIQTGAILAVVVYFRRRLFPFYRSQTAAERRGVLDLWLRAVVGMLPAVAVGLAAEDFIEARLMRPAVVAASLVAWGAVILVVESRNARLEAAGRRPAFGSASELPWRIVLAVGLFQCLGMIPGTSRSAATIVGAMLLGSGRVAAAEFSFFLAIPTLIGAGGYSLLKALRGGLALGGAEAALLAVGTAVAFLSAWAVVAFLMDFIGRRDFRAFGWYRIGLGALVLALLAF